MPKNKDKAFEDFFGVSPDKMSDILEEMVGKPLDDVNKRVREARRAVSKPRNPE